MTGKTALDKTEEASLVSFITKFQDTTMWHSQAFNNTEYEIVAKMITGWAPADRFPAIDLASLMVHHPHGAKHYVESCNANADDNLFDILVVSLLDEQVTSVVGNCLTIWRFISNCFVWPDSRRSLYDSFDLVIDASSSQIKHQNKIVRAAVATALLNLCVASREYNEVENLKAVVAKLLLLLSDEHPPVVALALQGLGTAAFRQPEVISVIKAASLAGINEGALSDDSKQMLQDLKALIK
eukprot:TRINITY_DN1930_c0_g1_i2.p1 TRINITY_DN1930_c0_g1~~TRINITY_DN1930_c0_g1_i2.p1  ORF type:complete len:241 (+),score=37.16 TRINITY_DN1930_c0_g1_i2:535-1257(+)